MYVIAGLVLGALLAIFLPITIPSSLSQYVAVALFGAIDSAFGGIVAMLRGRFQLKAFLLGFFGNALIAFLMTYIGTKLDINLFLAVAVIFGTRIFQNFADMLRYLLTFKQKKDKIVDNDIQKDSEV